MNPDPIIALIEKGVAHHRAGQYPDAERCYQVALQSRPNDAQLLHLIGVLAGDVGRSDVAVGFLERAIRLEPNNPDLLSTLAEQFRRLNRIPEAINLLDRAIRLKPDHFATLVIRGRIERTTGNLQTAIEYLTRAISINPNDPSVLTQLGHALIQSGRLEEALAAFTAAARLAPGDSEIRRHRASVLAQLARLDDCISELKVASVIHPQNPEVHLDLANALLLRGDWSEAWPHYEWRWQSNRFPRRSINVPQWDGSLLNGRSVMIHAEQGYGDMIQLARYLPELTRRGGTGAIVVDPEVLPLFDGLFGFPAALSDQVQGRRFDFHLPLASFPLVCQTTPMTIPGGVPYLTADPKRVEFWREKLGPHGCKLRVGIAWAGRPTHYNDRNRSVRLEQFTPLVAAGDIEFFSLQKGPAAEQIRALPTGISLIDQTEHLQTFADTAALLTQLDLLISVDTSLVHLAGAMGVPAWVLLPFVPDWRWGLAGETSNWYPSLRLFRQTKTGDWKDVFDRVAVELSNTTVRASTAT